MSTLFVVGTPIGNLEDLSQRVIRVLKEVDRVAAEDTRHTKKLLSHLGITGKPLESIESHQIAARVSGLVARLEAGESIALVTDAGMPGVSDPGSLLVRAARERGIKIESVPGPSAVTTAVAASGLVDGGFRFIGFLPRKGSARREALERIQATPEAVVLFESPNRAQQTLQDLAALTPEREVCVGRELTKLHEEFVWGTASELGQREHWRGELTLVLGPHSPLKAEVSADELDAAIRRGLHEGRSAKDLAQELAEHTGRPRREIYQRILQLAD
ncbi:MAG: 16S rRNA (cytidine(1402)-2'-O)-methyltransferase [Polyangiaceae bacterium]|nr:16S rRNA (cytidine(1402)-2'-O)-methyltransferase [Polyangiaceae bacterium]